MIFFAYRSTPAPGHRHTYYGTLWSVGYNGFGWSSFASGGNAHYLLFYYSFLARMASKTPNGCGFPLRCLQEEVRATTAAKHLLKKFGLAPTPLKAVQNPGWSAQRHRRGRAMQSIANGSAKFSVRSLTAFFLPQPPRRGGRPPPPPAEGRCRWALQSGPTGKKVRPVAHPPRRFAPGRRGRRLCESRRAQPNFFVRNSAGISPWRPPPPHRLAPVPLGTRKLELASTTTAVRLTRKASS